MKAMLTKVLAALLVVTITAGIAITGTLAYLTDRDSEANVFTVGDVAIDLTEDFEDGATLIPGVDITKEPSITNTGKNDAWVWAEIAIPALLDNEDASKNVIHFNFSKESVVDGLWNWQGNGDWMMRTETIDEIEYNVYTVLYETALKPGETTAEPVMTKVYMDPHVDITPEGDVYHVENGVAEDLGWNVNEYGQPVIYVSAYAMQAEGFTTALDAYNAYTEQWTTDADVNNGLEWGEAKLASTNEELEAAIENGASINLNSGEYTLPSLKNNEGVTITGAADGSSVVGGEDATTGFGSNFGKDSTFKNLTFNGSNNGVRWSYANGGTTTFDNCTFAGDSVYGFHIDSSNGATFIFNDCTFSGFNAFAGDLEKVVFNNCTFLNNGNYGHTNIWSVAELNNCTFGDNTSIGQGKNSGAKLYFDGVEESYHHEYIGSAESLFAFAKSVNEDGDSWTNQAVILVDDIDLNNEAWTPIGQTGATEFKGIFDGKGHTIKNLNVDNSAKTDAHTSSGLFGWAESNVTIQNVKIDRAKVVGNHNVAVIVGYTYSGKISNCHVANAEIVCKHANDDACGDKCGLIAGYAGDESRIAGCTGSDSTVTAGRDAGQLIGAGYNVSVSGCSATNVDVSASGECTGANVNDSVIGRTLG